MRWNTATALIGSGTRGWRKLGVLLEDLVGGACPQRSLLPTASARIRAALRHLGAATTHTVVLKLSYVVSGPGRRWWPASWPLTGRDAELDVPWSPPSPAGRGGGRRPARCGRSRLLAEAADRLAGPPGGPCAGSRAPARSGPSPTAPSPRSCPTSTGPIPARCSPPSSPTDGKLLLVVDDGQDLDDALAAAVLQLTGRAAVLVAVRTGAPVPESITALWKDGVATRIEVAALSGRCHRRPARRRARRPRSTAPPSANCSSRSGSSTVLLRELVQSALDAGVLVDVDGLLAAHRPRPR